MPLLDLALVKGHLRVLGDDEDAQIALYQAAAESAVVEHLDRVVQTAEPLPADDDTAMIVTPDIQYAILLLVGELYDTREPDPKDTGDAVLPKGVRRLLAPYRVWRRFEEDDDVVEGAP
jgi:hypothetical protein